MSISYAVFCLKAAASTAIYSLSLHDALPILAIARAIERINAKTAAWIIHKSGSGIQPTCAKIKNKAQATASEADWPPLALSISNQRGSGVMRSEEHTSELQSHVNLVCRLLLEGSCVNRDLLSFPTRRSSDLSDCESY